MTHRPLHPLYLGVVGALSEVLGQLGSRAPVLSSQFIVPEPLLVPAPLLVEDPVDPELDEPAPLVEFPVDPELLVLPLPWLPPMDSHPLTVPMSSRAAAMPTPYRLFILFASTFD